MALSKDRRRSFARGVSLGHAALAIWCLVRLVRVSGLPSHYYAYHRTPEAFVYPAHDVGVWCSVIGFEVVVTAWILFYARSLAGAALAMALLFGIAMCGFGVLGMHAPPYFTMHTIFLMFSAGWLALASLAAWLAGTRIHDDDARLEAAVAPAAPRRTAPDDTL